ncbi:hypothetical protein GCM10007049_22630 [Echinicola pacifica]|uniref:DUF2306 domain-containing protein n=1 Tax=Echinicola pacifica TaxID=346377 RepID=A0A918PZQ3_9BACT|nr:DUF2306 domain-containing protein [Echinicola pacifica]GGZ28996.1 hypothetical protein GCM10007049_22630 [Echinicola pacifica]
METISLTKILIFFHAGFGALALFSGGIALFAKKGQKLHRGTGRIFFYAMLTSALTALLIAVLPGHQNAFLFSIGVFSLYFLISGFRSVKYRIQGSNLLGDYILAIMVMITGLSMILIPLLFYGVFNIVLGVFGIVSLIFGFRDLKMLQKPGELQANWMKLHLGKMTGGYIAAVSAFLVVNQVLPWLWNWIVPSLLGSVYISYWMVQVNAKNKRALPPV